MSKIESSGVKSVQFVRDCLVFDLAKYLLAEDSEDYLRQMDFSIVWLDAVVWQGAVTGLEQAGRTQAGRSWRHLLCSVITKDWNGEYSK